MSDQLQDLGTTLVGASECSGECGERITGKALKVALIETWKLVSPFSLEMHESRMPRKRDCSVIFL